jgi:glycosyltransferase involved in cell wall biosynthesis
VLFGALDERIDRELLRAVIKARPDLRFLLVGPGMTQSGFLSDASNVERQEAVSYAELPGLLSQCGVALLPYVRGDFGARLSPLKAREALAAGLPVVASDVPELRSLPRGVHLARTAEEMLAALTQALAAREDVANLEELAADSWEARAEQLSQWLLAARVERRAV